jgi:hypothetical protein
MQELDYGFDYVEDPGRRGRGDYASFGGGDRQERAPRQNGGGGRGKKVAARGRGAGGRGSGRGGGRGGAKEAKEAPASAESLDADMDSYFSSKVRFSVLLWLSMTCVHLPPSI